MLKKCFLLFSILLLSACGGGGSDSGGAVAPTAPGNMLPAELVGTYRGTITLTASAGGISQTITEPLTITVMADGTLTFATDDADETVTVGVDNAGNFAASLDISEDECTGTISVTGQVTANLASGDVDGSGTCSDGGLTLDVEIDGSFSASR